MQYVINILKNRIIQEEKSLKFFENNLLSLDPLTIRQAEGNISSNKSRLLELKNACEKLLTKIK